MRGLFEKGVGILFLILLLCSSASVSAGADDSHSKWFEVDSIEWISHKPTNGDAHQVKLMKTYALVKLSNGKVIKVWAAKIKLQDGREIVVDKGRLIKSKAKQPVDTKPIDKSANKSESKPK